MSNILSETPTVDTTESHVQKPTWEVRINGSPDTRIFLKQVTLGYGSTFSTAVFSIEEDPDTGSFPAYNDAVEVDINSLNVFKGKIKGITSRISQGALNKLFTAISNITELTEKVVDPKNSKFNQSTVPEEDRLNVAQILTEILGYTPAGSPTDDPGAVSVTDMTQLDAVQTVVNKVGNFKLFWNKDTNLVELYRFGQGGDVTRRFEKGVNIIDFGITENRQGVVDKLTIVGPARAIRKRELVGTSLAPDENGVYKQSFTITGTNVRELIVEGQFRDRPFIEVNGDLQVLPEDMGITALTATAETREEINQNIGDLNTELDTITSNPQFDQSNTLQKKAAKVEDDITSEQGKLQSLLAEWPFFGLAEVGNIKRDVGFRHAVKTIIPSLTLFSSVGTSFEYNTEKTEATGFLSNVPRIYFHETISANVDKEKLGLSGGGALGDTIRVAVLTRLEWARGQVRVTYTDSGDCPQVSVGSGTVERTISDSQYQITQNNIDVSPSINNEDEVLDLMLERAEAEFEKVNKPSIGGTISVLGDETIELKSTVLVNSTKLDVVSITHSFERGFTTTVSLTNEPFISISTTRVSVPERRKSQEQSVFVGLRIDFQSVDIDQDIATQRQAEFQRRLQEAGLAFAAYQD